MEAEVCIILRDFGYQEEDKDLANGKSKTSRNGSYFDKKLMKLKKDELKFVAEDRCLGLKGNKIDLVKRIIKDIKNTPTNVVKANTGVNNEVGDINDDIHVRAATKGNKMFNGDSSASNTEKPKENFEKPCSNKELLHLRTDEENKIVEYWPENCLESLWLHPFKTLHYATNEICLTIIELKQNPRFQRKDMFLFALSLILFALSMEKLGPLMKNIYNNEVNTYLFCIPWWIGLGIISSVGVGSSLHTFVMYLIPYVALITLAEFESPTTESSSSFTNASTEDLQESSYIDFKYPHNEISNHFYTSNLPQQISISISFIFVILNKVKLEVFCFGLGSVFGELPSYFEAKHKGGLVETQKDNIDENDSFQRTNPLMKILRHTLYFRSFLARKCIPNSYLEVVAASCSYRANSFARFFIGTLIGKLIKSNCQIMILICTLNTIWTGNIITRIPRIPWINQTLEKTLEDFLVSHFQILVYCRKNRVQCLGMFLWSSHQKLLVKMVFFYILSVLNAFARSFHQRQTKIEGQNIAAAHLV